MNHEEQQLPPEENASYSRRDFVRVVGAAAASVPILGSALPVLGAEKKATAETTVQRFYETLSAPQKKTICFPFDHALRKKHHPNWITEPNIGSDFYTDDQRKLIDTILRGVTSEDGYERFQQQMKDDRPGGVGAYHVAVFGEPGSGKFEWEMTGRHLTVRADGDNVEGMAFGGPIVYGHSKSKPSENVFHYQTKKANEVFRALDPKQAKQALIAKAPSEGAVPLQGSGGSFPGLAVAELSDDQEELVEQTIKVILAPYRTTDVKEALTILNAGGGLGKLHMAFYQNGDLEKDEVWDIWRLEGPTFVWHFRGAPHVHAYINIGKKA